MNCARSSSAYGFATRNASSIGANANARPFSRLWTTGDANAAATIVTTTIPAWYLVATASPRPTPAITYSRIRPVR